MTLRSAAGPVWRLGAAAAAVAALAGCGLVASPAPAQAPQGAAVPSPSGDRQLQVFTAQPMERVNQDVDPLFAIQSSDVEKERAPGIQTIAPSHLTPIHPDVRKETVQVNPT